MEADMAATKSAPKRPFAVLAAAATLVTLAATLPAAAQVPMTTTPPPAAMPSDSINLTMEQRHVIKEIILKDLKIPAQGAHVAPKPGTSVPAGVTLQPLPVEVAAKVPQVRMHSYFVEDDKVIIVDPKDNKITTVVE
jgi:hypothetical protein